MPFTEEELKAIYSGYNPAPAPVPDGTDVPFKTLKQFGNLIPETVNETAKGVFGGLSYLAGYNPTKSDMQSVGSIAPTFDVGDTKTTGDFILNKVIPSVASWMIPYNAVGKASKALGAGRIGEGLAQGAANYLSTAADHSQQDANFQGGIGVASGIAQSFLPRAARILPLAGISALDYAKNGSALEAGVNFGFNMLPGHVRIPEAPGSFPSVESLGATHELAPSNFQDGPIRSDIGQGYPGQFEATMHPGEFSFVDNTPVRLPDELPSGLPDFQLNRNPYQQRLGLEPNSQGEPSNLQLEHPLDRLQRDYQAEQQQQAQPVEPQTESPLRLVDQQEAAKPQIAEETLASSKTPEPLSVQDIVPAIKVNGETILGNKGDIHQDILHRYMDANPDNVDAIMGFDHPDNPNFFVAKDGSEISRNQLKEQFGVSSAQELKELQAKFALRPISTEGGKTNTEMLGTLGLAAGVGALVYQGSKGKGKDTSGDIGLSLAAAVITAGLGAAGINALKKFKARTGPEVSLGTGVKDIGDGLKGKMTRLARDTMQTPAGAAVGGQGGIWANSVHKFETLTGMNGVEGFKHAKIHAGGFVANEVGQLGKSWKISGKSTVGDITPAFRDASSRYLRGQLADNVLVQDIINSGGSVHESEWEGVKNKDNFPEKIMMLDDPMNTNTKGPGIDIWHVTNETKQKWQQAQQDALRAHATTPADLEHSKFILQSRKTTDILQQMVIDGLPVGSPERARLAGTQGQWMVRSHAIIEDPNFYPSNQAIENAKTKLGIRQENAYMSENGSDIPTATKTQAVHWRGITKYMTPEAAGDFQFLHSPESLHAEIRDMIHELKTDKELKAQGLMPKDSEQFMSSLFSGRKELDEVQQALLGTHNAPIEMVQNTLNKIVPAAQVSHFMQDAIQRIDPKTGLKVSLNEINYNKQVQDLKRLITDPTTSPKDLDHAKFQLSELASYSRMADNPRFSLAKDTFVSRDLKRHIDSFDGSAFGFMDNVIGKGLRDFNTAFKTAHLALSPATVARQIFQAPLMMLMGNVRSISAIVNGWKGYFNRTEGLGKWMVEHGVFSSSAIHSEFQHSLADFTSGQMEKTIWDRVKNGIKGAQKLFSAPDDIVRASVFMGEAERVAKEMGVPLDSMNPEVGRRAMEFTARRAQDYSNLPNYVKIGKNIPGVNIFLAYTHEIARVTKNMVLDATKGDLQAGATLAGIATFPFLLQKMSEDSLSSVDRAAWEQAKAVAPDYARSRFISPISRNKDGTFTTVDWTSIIPHNDYLQMARSIMNKDAAGFAAVNPFVGIDKSPFLSITANQIAGKDTHSQKDFRGFQDRAKDVAQQLLPGWTPGVGHEWEKSMPEALGGNLGDTNIKTGKTNTGIGALLRNLTGVNISQVNPDMAVANTVKEAQHEIANAKQYMMDTIKLSGKSKAAQDRAQQQFVDAVTQIATDLDHKINLTKANK